MSDTLLELPAAPPAPAPAAPRDTFALVAVDQRVESELSYRVPPDLLPDVKPGSRVAVPLGRGNHVATGTVLELTDQLPQALLAKAQAAPAEPPAETLQLFASDQPGQPGAPDGLPEPPPRRQAGPLKDIQDVLRDVLPVPADLLALGRWLAHYYCTPVGVTLSTMVPAAVKRNTRLPMRIMLHLAPAAADTEAFLADHKLSPRTRAAYLALHALLAAGPMNERIAMDKSGLARPMLRRLVEKGALVLERLVVFPEMPGTTPPPPPTPADPAAPDAAPAPDATAPAPQPAAPVGPSDAGHCTLTPEQHAALEDISAAVREGTFAVRLVHGVTGSGKTELYIRAIEQVVAQGRRAIVLVPEISLTPQTVRRFTRRFARVAVLHSGLRDAQRHQHWHAIASGWAQVIVGARSAIFAPAADIGLIVVDEEHDGSYKQDSAPRYHGRDVAIRRAQMLNVPVVLGSATPALETWHNAQGANPHYRTLSLRTRPLGTEMPQVITVDMKDQSRQRRGLHILSTVMEHHLKQTLDRNRQALLLLNRRGYAHYCLCPRCDWVLMCDNCDATMVVHRNQEGPSAPRPAAAAGRAGFEQIYGTVQCHYCMTAQVLPPLCPLCKARLTHLGQGTQRAEDELLRKFPGLSLARMDSDSMRDAIDYQRTLQRFADGDLQVIIGTQMISKGLDFPNVALVGVLNADLAMTAPDFRAAERTFQLVCQVAGRSGRARERGIVVVQTFQPQEPAIVHACNHDYEAFVRGELEHRREFGYPPYGRMVRFVVSHKLYDRARADAEALLRNIQAVCTSHALPVRWHGPQPPPMERLVELYRSEIILFANAPAPLQRLLAILRQRQVLTSRPSAIMVDVDPIHLA